MIKIPRFQELNKVLKKYVKLKKTYLKVAFVNNKSAQATLG
jgi:hypothetical protein